MFSRGLDIAAFWLLTQINAAERLLDPQFRPISLSCRFSDDSGRGPRQLGGKIDFWSLLDRRDLQPRSTREPLSGAPTFVRRAAEHRDVAEVLIILGRGDWISWHDLYKIFEIVRDNVGSHKALIAKGWKSTEDISAFTVSANSPMVSGAGARHARLNDGIPRHTMTYELGRAFIDQLVLAWLAEMN
jgi:hypothetical protein